MDLVEELNNKSKDSIAIIEGIDTLVDICHDAAVQGGWWHDLETGQRLNRNKAELLMLIVSEIAEGMEALRKNLMDDKLPDRPGIEVELADAVIRIADFCGAYDLDLAGAILDKIEYNAKRADHKPENRRKTGGKSF
jgi:NTP pyrophosphatase (non-canonical NTP hydrolase)